MARYNMRIKRESRTPVRTRRDDEIISIGNQMSNVFFNLSQRGDGISNIHLAANEYAPFGELFRQWDEAKRKYRQSFKRGKP